jgi:hypothetical protein
MDFYCFQCYFDFLCRKIMMKIKLTIIFFISFSVFNAYSAYVRLPSGIYFEVPEEFKSYGGGFASCLAYMYFPKEFNNSPPIYCGGDTSHLIYKGMIGSLFFLTKNDPPKYMPYKDGSWYENIRNLRGLNLVCTVSSEFGSQQEIYEGMFDIQNSCSKWKKEKEEVALIDTIKVLGLKIGLAIPVFFLLTFKLKRKALISPVKNGVYFGAWSLVSGILIFNEPFSNQIDFYVKCFWFVVLFYILGFVLGLIAYKIKPTNINNSSK